MVREKLGLPAFTPSKKTNGKDKPRKEIVARYDYCDESAELLFQVVRFDPKDFRQRKPNDTPAVGRGNSKTFAASCTSSPS